MPYNANRQRRFCPLKKRNFDKPGKAHTSGPSFPKSIKELFARIRNFIVLNARRAIVRGKRTAGERDFSIVLFQKGAEEKREGQR